jgi:hypothetical protein
MQNALHRDSYVNIAFQQFFSEYFAFPLYHFTTAPHSYAIHPALTLYNISKHIKLQTLITLITGEAPMTIKLKSKYRQQIWSINANTTAVSYKVRLIAAWRFEKSKRKPLFVPIFTNK